MPDQFDRKEFQRQMQKIEGLVRTMEAAADPNVRASAIELMQSLMSLHGAGIERMMEIVFDAGEAATGGALIDRFAEDEVVASLLLLYDLHPLDVETRVAQALDKVRPSLDSHGGNVELLGINDGVVRLKLHGSCQSCSSSTETLKRSIEEAIYEAAPEITAIEAEQMDAPVAPTKLVQLERRASYV